MLSAALFANSDWAPGGRLIASLNLSFSSYGPMDVDGEEDLNFGREGPRVVKLPPGMPPAPPSPGLDSQEQRWD